MSSFDENIKEWMDWSVKTFEKATHLSSLEKLDDELRELRQKLSEDELVPSHEKLEEYVDCIMCLIHSAAKYGFTADELRGTFQRKFILNKFRTWKLNPNNTYSHIAPRTEF